MDGNKRHALRHYTNISVQRIYEIKNLNGHLRNYESILEIRIHKREIQTAESTTSVHVCLTVVSFSPTACNTKYQEKGNEAKEIKPCIKCLHVNCTLKLPNRYMENSQIYFIHQWRIQNFDYNPTEGSHEFPFRNRLFLFLFFVNSEQPSIYRQLLQKNMDIVNGINWIENFKCNIIINSSLS